MSKPEEDSVYQAALDDAEICSKTFHSPLAKQLTVLQRKTLIQKFQHDLYRTMQSMNVDDDLDAMSSIRYEMVINKMMAANEVDKLRELAKKNPCAALYLLSMDKFSDENKFNLIIDHREDPVFATEFNNWLPKDFIFNLCKEDPYKLNLVCHYPILLNQLNDTQLDELLLHHQSFLEHAINSPEYPKADDNVLHRLRALQDLSDKTNNAGYKSPGIKKGG